MDGAKTTRAVGTLDGDGCQTLPEHTSEYWSNMAYNNPDLFERFCNGDFDY